MLRSVATRTLARLPTVSRPLTRTTAVRSFSTQFSPLHEDGQSHLPPAQAAQWAADEKERAAGYNSTDHYFIENLRSEADRKADPTNRAYTYAVLGAGKLVYASMARIAVVKIVSTMSASADVLALASIEVDLASIAEGTSLTVKWRGKPVFIRHRTPKEIALAKEDDNADLRDPQKDSERVQKDEWMIVMGVCTHLGCVPAGNAGDYHGWFCPCHGSHYDTSGRIRKGPAPLNLEVPQYKFLSDTKVLIG